MKLGYRLYIMSFIYIYFYRAAHVSGISNPNESYQQSPEETKNNREHIRQD